MAWVNVWASARGGRSGFAVVLFASCLGGCIDDFDHPEGYGTGAQGKRTTTSSGYDCKDVCEESSGCYDEDVGGCASQCGVLEDAVRASNCYESYQAVLACYEHASSVCTAQDGTCFEATNEFSGCVTTYCENHPADCGGLY